VAVLAQEGDFYTLDTKVGDARAHWKTGIKPLKETNLDVAKLYLTVPGPKRCTTLKWDRPITSPVQERSLCVLIDELERLTEIEIANRKL